MGSFLLDKNKSSFAARGGVTFFPMCKIYQCGYIINKFCILLVADYIYTLITSE